MRIGRPTRVARMNVGGVSIEALALSLTREHEQGRRVRFVAKPEEPEEAPPPPPPPNQGLLKSAEKQRSKTHCPFGHPYSKENTRVAHGSRFCRRCVTERSAARRARAYWERNDGVLLGMLGAMG